MIFEKLEILIVINSLFSRCISTSRVDYQTMHILYDPFTYLFNFAEKSVSWCMHIIDVRLYYLKFLEVQMIILWKIKYQFKFSTILWLTQKYASRWFLASRKLIILSIHMNYVTDAFHDQNLYDPKICENLCSLIFWKDLFKNLNIGSFIKNFGFYLRVIQFIFALCFLVKSNGYTLRYFKLYISTYKVFKTLICR